MALPLNSLYSSPCYFQCTWVNHVFSCSNHRKKCMLSSLAPRPLRAGALNLWGLLCQIARFVHIALAGLLSLGFLFPSISISCGFLLISLFRVFWQSALQWFPIKYSFRLWCPSMELLSGSMLFHGYSRSKCIPAAYINFSILGFPNSLYMGSECFNGDQVPYAYLRGMECNEALSKKYHLKFLI